MKNYKVKAIRFFRDASEIDKKTGLKVERKVNDEFLCTKERYEFLKANNAVKLVEVLEEKKEPEQVFETENSKFIIGNNEFKVEVNEISLIDNNDNEIIINKEEVKPKPKKKKSSKK